MNRKNLPIYLSLATIFGILIGTLFNGGNAFVLSGKASNEAKIKRLMEYIDKDYVDDVNTEELLDNAITNILGKLDPHSVYIPKENMQAVQESMQGNFVGIGVQFRMINDSITVIQPIKGGPSIKAGIKAGDRILLANNDTLFGKKMSSSLVPKFLKGAPNTEVKLKVYRKTNDSLFTVDLVRNKVNIKSVDLAYMLTDKIGYIKLDRFAQNSYKEFKTSLENLIEQGMNDLVIDLRGNGGGYVYIAISILDELLSDKTLMVFTKNNKGKVIKSYATDKGLFENGGLYVLIDENSASASEIVAGALQDNDKGTIIGRRSFGKGLVQQEMGLGDGSAVRLTTARYYTPTGRSIQRPYNKKGDDSYYNDYRKRINSGELLDENKIPVADSLQFTTPKGKIVYGGGGIIPDVFVPIDTTMNLNNLYFRTINDFAFDYVDANRKKLTKKWTLDAFLKDFDQDAKVYNIYMDKLKDFNPSFKTRAIIKKYLKASVANVLFGDVGFYKVIHQDDNMLQKVLELDSKKE